MSEQKDMTFCDTCPGRGETFSRYRGQPIAAQYCARTTIDFANRMTIQLTSAAVNVAVIDDDGAVHDESAEEAISPFIQGFVEDALGCIDSMRRTGEPLLMLED